VRWHAARLQRKPLSAVGWQMVIVAATIAKVLGRTEAAALATVRNNLGTPEILHKKEAHWITLAELNAVGDAWLREGRQPLPKDRRDRHHGARLAGRFQKGVILKFLVRIPLRLRNIRELQLPKNLYQDHTGHWMLHFRGADLKIGRQGGRRGTIPNEYKLDLSDDSPTLLALLHEWRTTYRPRLPGAAESPYLFLNHQGRPFSENLGKEITLAVGLKTDTETGKRFFPHMIRTIWTTAYLTHPKTYGDFLGAATRLGDQPQTVIKSYSHLFKKDLHARAADFLAEEVPPGDAA
jgi:hypothetical protein